jgi:hypothetical protein
MIKVLRHGDTISVTNPVDGRTNTMINVVFIEEGRSGANKALSGSTDFLNNLVGLEVGLEQVRTHTQPVLATQIEHFPVGREYPGHINRSLYSVPQMRQQIGREPRMVDGKPTFFATELSEKAEEDKDFRLSIDILASIKPEEFANVQYGASEVRVLESRARVLPSGNLASGSAGQGAPAGVTGAGVQS